MPDTPSGRAHGGRGLTTAGLIAVTAATLLMMAWAIFPTGTARADDGCPHTADRVDHQGSSGSYMQGSVTVSWTGSTVTVSGGTATFCVKAGNGFALLTLTNSSFVLTCSNAQGPAPDEFCNSQGQLQGISHVSEYNPPTPTTTVPGGGGGTTTVPGGGGGTTTVPGGGGGTTVPTTTPPPAPTTTPPSIAPTTVTPKTTTRSPSVAPTTVQPNGTAFTGPENVVPIGAIALALMMGGSGLLWAGSRRKRDQDQE
jgi:hypothetical protein